jgi:hypothetical protein
MLRLAGEQVEALFDELLPVEVRELRRDLAVLDRLLADPRLQAPIKQAWAQTAEGMAGRQSRWPASCDWWWSSSAPAGATRRWCGRCRTRCTCAGSACCR